MRMQRQAERCDRALPALLPRGRARRGGGAHRFLERVVQAAPLADRAAARPARRARSASRTSLVVARMSRLNWQRPGTTLIEPLGTSSMPTVPTTFGTAAARCST